MQRNLFLWCPVVVNRLASPRSFKQYSSYQTTENYKKIDDMKMRIISIECLNVGQYVETKLIVSWICLLEDNQGQLLSVKREEVLKDRVSLRELQPWSEQQSELRYLYEVKDFTWDARLECNAIQISYELLYRIMGTKEQFISVQAVPEQNEIKNAGLTSLTPADPQINAIDIENQKLRRQIHLYETNIKSLKKGIQKAEKDNTNLKIELKNYKEMVDGLQDRVRKKQQPAEYTAINPFQEKSAKAPLTVNTNNLGQRIKNLFMNNA